MKEFRDEREKFCEFLNNYYETHNFNGKIYHF